MLVQSLLWLFVGVLGGATASVAGFGIGSLLTPVLAASYSPADAILAVSIPHAVATAVRGWRLRASIDREVLRGFGVASAIGGILGALVFVTAEQIAGRILGALLVVTGITGLTGWNRRVHPGRAVSAVLGGLSGLFGGMAGNQGGLRAAALTAYDLTPAAFVATSTAVGLMVDAARLPVYVSSGTDRLAVLAVPIAVATLGVLAGTLWGERILRRMDPVMFERVVSALILGLGVWLLLR